MKIFKENSLYLVTSQEYSGRRNTLDVVKSAVLAGIDIVQMREKEMTRKELVWLGKEIFSLCQEKDIIFIVNDDPLLAEEVGADGVHLGQGDIKIYNLKKTRDILGKEKIIGVSTHSLSQFEKANSSDCDYIAFGPIFSTKTKDYSIGVADIKKVLDLSLKPVVFIGGINLDNLDIILNKGAKNIAMIRALVNAEDIVRSIKDFKNKLNDNNFVLGETNER
ncbi:MAG: thiamine phosphate synthase [Candidatus Omnitrophica bacterium]|nr:thiamine phosphate synthase [Candidatus Omnitrophota bacterium]MCK5493937.1 thiamine phosphate synthase [Candidatus Omnitrophota bacterium]